MKRERPPNDNSKNNISKKLLFGGLAGVCAKFTTAPLERLKILEQTGGSKDTWRRSVKAILRSEGLHGMWRGCGINCLRTFPNKAILFSSNDFFRKLLKKKLLASENGSKKGQMFIGFLSGALAGVVATVCTHPLDVARVRKQGAIGRNNPQYETLRGTLVIIHTQGGFSGLYRGFVITATATFFYSALRFGIYEYLEVAGNKRLQPTAYDMLYLRPLYAAAAGSLSSVVMYPLDTGRRVMQMSGATGFTNYTSSRDALWNLVKDEGLLRLYRGMSLNLIRVVPSTAVQFSVYGFLNSHFLIND